MKLFCWESEMLADYSPGQIIVMGRNLEHARNVARTAFKGRYLNPSADQATAFECDIAKEPKVDIGFFIHGGA